MKWNGTEAKRIHKKNRSGSHGENVSDNTTDTGGCALERLDGTRMIMTLDLESHRPPVTDVDDTGILLTRLDQNARA